MIEEYRDHSPLTVFIFAGGSFPSWVEVLHTTDFSVKGPTRSNSMN